MYWQKKYTPWKENKNLFRKQKNLGKKQNLSFKRYLDLIYNFINFPIPNCWAHFDFSIRIQSAIMAIATTLIQPIESTVLFNNDENKRRGLINNIENGNELQQAVFVHTFGTEDSCSRNCPRQCVAQDLDDLPMMQRWICPTKLLSEAALNSVAREGVTSINMHYDNGTNLKDLIPFSSQFLLIIIPLGLLIFILISIVWCRKCSSNSN